MTTIVPFGDGTVSYSRVVLSSAQVMGMFNNRVEVVERPGLDAAIVVHSCSVEVDFFQNSFSNGGDLIISYEHSGANPVLAAEKIPGSFVRKGADYMIMVNPKMGDSDGVPQNTVLHNSALVISNEGAPFENGTGRLVVHVWYTKVRTI